ncbi:MAG: nickel pincer cofactor-dependent isomerase, group 22 [Planctomycetota bacterium]|jgi:hypothetical protein
MLKLTKVRQHFKRRPIENIEAALLSELENVKSAINPGAKIAIAVGSRGITNISDIVRITVDFIKERGANPFVIPAMGSHGGATREGQKEVLADYGITEEFIGAEIKSSMEVVEIPQGDNPNRIFMDKFAYESDGVILINRVKAHTDYHGEYESGLVKMAVIGLGKHQQALEIHRFGVYGLKELIPKTAEHIFASGKIIGGIALVEDAYHSTMLIRALQANEIMKEEPKLLKLSNDNMPKLPAEKIDVLIVDRIGKNISGVGMDPNIIGRIRIIGESEPASPDIKSIIVCDVTDESHGNALGMGLANVTTKKLFNKIDFQVTYENVYTSTFLERAKIPVVAETPKEALGFALRSCGPVPQEKQRIVRILDTLNLDEVYVSEVILGEISDEALIEVFDGPVDMFDTKGELTVF